MPDRHYANSLKRKDMSIVGVLVALLSTTAEVALGADLAPRQARIIQTANFEYADPQGLIYNADAGELLLFEAPRGTARRHYFFGRVNMAEELVSEFQASAYVATTVNIAYDNFSQRLLMYSADKKLLVGLDVDSNGKSFSDAQGKRIGRIVTGQANGLSVDPRTGHLYILDVAGPSILHLVPDLQGRFSVSAEIKLDSFAGNAQALQGLAVHTPTGFLHTIDTEKNQLVVFDSKGRMLAQHSLSHTNVRQAHGMVFAPSGDTTDAADTLSLFVVDRQLGGAIVELAWDVAAAGFRFMGALPMAGQGTDVAAALVRSIDTASFSPPSPDPAGIVYLEASSTFMISDSEVNEMANLFTGDNMFEMNLAGDLIATSSSMAYTKEPAGVTLNTSNGHLFIADDNRDEIFEVAAGPDNIYGSSDDVVTKFDTRAFGSYDPEGLSYDTVQQRLFIADGLNAQVYTLTPGLNGVFDGVPPDGDDQYSSFDTAAMGITDPEGIAFDPDSSTLYVVGEPTTVLAQMTVSGQLLRLIDISAPNPSPMIPAGLAIAPSSENPTQNNIYVADRRYDNDFDPSENDGKVYEFSIPPISAGNTPPVVSAGGDQNVVMPNSIALNATVTDDGLPNPPSTLVTNWTLASGDGTATFADPSQVNTTVSFSNAGTYVLRLEATDGELTSSDEMSCVVTSTNETVFQVRVAAAADDVEQTDTGKMLFTSTDLDMAVDKVKWGEQTIGMRFLGVEIPADAIVTDAYIQFQTDEVHTDPVELNVVGELAANSAGFINIRHNVSDRSQTANSVNWSPLAWETIGEAGIAQRTPDLSAVIQEIVTAPGWTPGNAMTFIVTGTGKRSAEAYEGTQTGAPLLRVVFHTP